jgi:hypothetical protein
MAKCRQRRAATWSIFDLRRDGKRPTSGPTKAGGTIVQPSAPNHAAPHATRSTNEPTHPSTAIRGRTPVPGHRSAAPIAHPKVRQALMRPSWTPAAPEARVSTLRWSLALGSHDCDPSSDAFGIDLHPRASPGRDRGAGAHPELRKYASCRFVVPRKEASPCRSPRREDPPARERAAEAAARHGGRREVPQRRQAPHAGEGRRQTNATPVSRMP